MGADASKSDPQEPGAEKINFVADLREACQADNGKGDVKEFVAKWKQFEKYRGPEFNFDASIIDEPHNVMRYIKYAFRHSNVAWREAGIRIAWSFFHVQEARMKLANLDFVGSLLLITLPDENEEEEEEDDEEKAGDVEQQNKMQLLAAKILCEMADHAEFSQALCSTNVLNFLCIVLNRVAAAVEIVTHTFMKLSWNEENLAILMEGAVGDILESFFKTVNFKRPKQEDDEDLFEQWKKDVYALGYCAHTLATLIKYNHQCKVDLPRCIDVFDDSMQVFRDRDGLLDNVHLLAEMARLFYWVCRKSGSVVGALNAASSGDLDRVLKVLVTLWERCVETHDMVMAVTRNPHGKFGPELDKFMTDDLQMSKKLKMGSYEAELKLYHSRQRLCYVNCTLWVLLEFSDIRWKLKALGVQKLNLAFQLTDPEFLRVILSTVRCLLDNEYVQACHDFTRFFGVQLLKLLDEAVAGRLPDAVIRLLLDAICIAAMQRDMQNMLAEPKNDIYAKLGQLLHNASPSKDPDHSRKTEYTAIRILALVAVNPCHRMSWVSKDEGPAANYPPRGPFKSQLEGRIRESDEGFKTLASLLFTVYLEDKFKRQPAEVATTLKAVLDWWQVNTTARYEEEKEIASIAAAGGASPGPERIVKRPLQELLRRAIIMREQHCTPTSMEALPYCAPHECVLALSLFSRLALEPKFKRFFYDEALQSLLGCVCVGIWPEAREAAATLANLMWLPDLNEEHLVCWLKFDGPMCVSVDASNVCLAVQAGNSRPVDIGKGMYKSTWGVEFVEGSCVTLHPDGLRTNEVPGTLTSASPEDAFDTTSRCPYEFLSFAKDWYCPNCHERNKPTFKKCTNDECYAEFQDPLARQFTISCWFYWPLAKKPPRQHVLIQTTPRHSQSQIYLDCETESEGVWTLTDETGRKHALKTPKLNNGWHMLTLVSCSWDPEVAWAGTKFFLDTWHCSLEDVFVKNEFYVVGNSVHQGGKKPFGLICDFRIYARSLPDKEVEEMARARDIEGHPDRIARRLASMDAATILAQRLNLPDSAAECLRALGNLATLRTQRAKIYGVCGPKVLQMLDSPLPNINRQAARLLNNIA